MKPAVLRPQAERDFESNIDYHPEADAPLTALAERFFAAADTALHQIERRPGMGSLRIGELRGVPLLRSWPVKGFPLQWFYFERENDLDVVRLLGDRQDSATIPS
jgi:toxin ParE1/3/4